MKKRFFAIIFAALLSLTFFVACGKDKTEEGFVPPVYNPANNPYDGQSYLKESMKIRFGDDFETGMTVVTIPSTVDPVTDYNVDFLVLENSLKTQSLLRSSTGKYSEKSPLDLTSIKTQLKNARKKGMTVRGHALAWYQMGLEEYIPWFFKDDDGNFVTSEVLKKRMTDYIDDLFSQLYGGTGEENYADVLTDWDVVNEVAREFVKGDSQAPMPTTLAESLRDPEQDWFRKIMGDNYIVEIFKIAEAAAEKYSVKDKITFTYNDYDSEIDPKKDRAIEIIVDTLIKENCKLDNIGFQMHVTYGFDKQGLKDTLKTFENKGKTLVISELDMNMKGLLSKPLNELYSLQAKEYLQMFDIFDDCKAVKAVNFWGTTDDKSWICFDGPGSDYPLLFDKDKQPKPAFWILVDPARAELEPDVISAYYAELPTTDNKEWKYQNFTSLKGDVGGKFNVLWDEADVYVYVDIDDPTQQSVDEIRLYFDMDFSREETYGDSTMTFTAKRSSLKERADGSGYFGVITCDVGYVDEMVTPKIGFDIVACDGKKGGYWHDETFRQQTYPKGFGAISPKKVSSFASAPKRTGAVTIDGSEEAAWKDALILTPEHKTDRPLATGTFKVMWDEEALYVLATVSDKVLSVRDSEHNSDSIEIFVDQDNAKATSYEPDDGQFRLGINGTLTHNSKSAYVTADNIEWAVTKKLGEGYVIEAKIKFTAISPVSGAIIGFDCLINDDPSGAAVRGGYLTWADTSNSGWMNPGVFGLLELK